MEFSTYATPTIVGEIKRHFRDKGWAVRVPRRLQELRLSLTTATEELSQRWAAPRRWPSSPRAWASPRRRSSRAWSPPTPTARVSLDAGDPDDDGPAADARHASASDDEALEGVEYRESLKPLLAQLRAARAADPDAAVLPRT